MKDSYIIEKSFYIIKLAIISNFKSSITHKNLS